MPHILTVARFVAFRRLRAKMLRGYESVQIRGFPGTADGKSLPMLDQAIKLSRIEQRIVHGGVEASARDAFMLIPIAIGECVFAKGILKSYHAKYAAGDSPETLAG